MGIGAGSIYSQGSDASSIAAEMQGDSPVQVALTPEQKIEISLDPNFTGQVAENTDDIAELQTLVAQAARVAVVDLGGSEDQAAITDAFNSYFTIPAQPGDKVFDDNAASGLKTTTWILNNAGAWVQIQTDYNLFDASYSGLIRQPPSPQDGNVVAMTGVPGAGTVNGWVNSVAAAANSDADTSTPALSGTLGSIMLSIWQKIRSLGNAIPTSLSMAGDVTGNTGANTAIRSTITTISSSNLSLINDIGTAGKILYYYISNVLPAAVSPNLPNVSGNSAVHGWLVTSRRADSSGNLSEQTLFCSFAGSQQNQIWTRTYYSAWSAWVRLANTADLYATLAATANTDITTTTLAVASSAVPTLLQTIWNKIRSVMNYIASNDFIIRVFRSARANSPINSNLDSPDWFQNYFIGGTNLGATGHITGGTWPPGVTGDIWLMNIPFSASYMVSGGWVCQVIFHAMSNQLWQRYANGTIWQAWQRQAVPGDLASYLPLAGGLMAQGATINWPNQTTGVRNLISATVGDNDQAAIRAGSAGSNAGYLELATGDDTNEPIYVSQYSGGLGTQAPSRRTALLDENGYMQLASFLHLGNGIQDTLPIGGVMFDDDSLSGYVRRVSYDVFRRKLLSALPAGAFSPGAASNDNQYPAYAFNDNFYLVNTGIWWGYFPGNDNAPINDGVQRWYGLINIRHRFGAGDGNLYGDQIAIGTQNAGLAGRMWTRSQNNGTWTGWVDKANTDIVISGTGAEAQLNAFLNSLIGANNRGNTYTIGLSDATLAGIGSVLVGYIKVWRKAEGIASNHESVLTAYIYWKNGSVQEIWQCDYVEATATTVQRRSAWQKIGGTATIGTYPQSIAVNSVQPGGSYLVRLTSSPINPILPSETVSFNISGLTGFTANDIGKAWTLFVSYPYMQDYKDVVVYFQDYSGESMSVRLHSYVPLGTYNVKQSVILTCLGIRGSTPFFAWT